ncbi:unnamed protein product, partial [Mesorhabditis belari]|uniref:T20D4.11-like domain-containing protein n=1 Tax=Mesorhabditis belari TaxID=2138241 RepID=A0AAF3EA39_9BILA
MRIFVLLLLLLIGVTLGQKRAASQPTATVQAPCPANTFTCKDGSCIPEDWVGDGEADCDDHSDEEGLEPVDVPPPSSIVPEAKPPKQKPQMESVPVEPVPADEGSDEEEEIEEEAFDEATPSTKAPTAQITGIECPAEHARRYEECGHPIANFIDDLARLNLSNMSLMEDHENLEKFEASCELLREYEICVEGAAPTCHHIPAVTAWKDIEMYVCQLLVPSVKEHTACFQKKRDPKCTVSIPDGSSTLCRVVSSMIQDMGCLEKAEVCEADAREMLVPIQMESEHIAKEIRCPPIPSLHETEMPEEEEKEEEKEEKEQEEEPVTTIAPMTEQLTKQSPTRASTTRIEIKETTPVTTTTTKQPLTTEKEGERSGESETPFESTAFENGDESEEVAEEIVTTENPTTTTMTTVSTTTMTTTEAVEEPEDLNDLAELEATLRREQSQIQNNRQTVVPIVHTTPVTTTVLPTTTKMKKVATGEAAAAMVSMVDAAKAMLSIEEICGNPVSNKAFDRLQKELCKRKEDIQEHQQCFQATIEKAKCAVREPTNACEALEAFNVNLDCAIITMNDECPVEAQDLVVEIQEQINDVTIEMKCFKEEEKQGENETPKGEVEFPLNPTLPKCTDSQENNALACLVELSEINQQMAQFQGQNFLLEIATENSTIVASICGFFEKYEKCLQASVFSETNGNRCSFASPLNTLARIGLQPLCDTRTKPLLARHRDCLLSLAQNPAAMCQSGLGGLGGAVQKMMQGVHSEALLCKSFYVIRDTFECGERKVAEFCDAAAKVDLGKVKQQMSEIGEEEGCPKVAPANLDEIIARPVQRPTPFPIPPPPQRASDIDGAPKARPLAPSSPRPVTPVPTCTPEQQKKFQDCVQPMTVFQPHPLSVIKVPKQIDEACAKFDEFKTCTTGIECHPLWAKGMSAMFEFACGEGMQAYDHVKQCVRKVSQAQNVKECVAIFSRGAPQQACFSANKLLSCAMVPVEQECGVNGTKFIIDYVTKFATAIDPRCKLASQIPIGRVVGVSCSVEEEALVDNCAAPLNDIGQRMEEMFHGGLNQLVKNANMLAPIFAGACNLTDEFRMCAAGPLSGQSPCIVSNCMVKAGEEICAQADPVKAIDDHLSCLFGQVQEPTFAKCVRSTLATVKQFSLSSFRSVLPKFTDCVEDVVKGKCGLVPIKILRSISSPELCPLSGAPIRMQPVFTGPPKPISNEGVQPVQPMAAGIVPARVEPTVCDAEKKTAYDQCVMPFYSKYRMLPIALLNDVDNMDKVCADVAIMDSCSQAVRICATPEQRGLKAMTMQVCASRAAFDQHKICLKNVISKNSSCMSQYLSSPPEEACAAIQAAANCMASQVTSECGRPAMDYTFPAMADYARYVDSKCNIVAPTIELTGCSEQDFVEYLNCDMIIDKFHFSPISIIGDATKWDEFCGVVEKNYTPCIDGLKCKFEPVSSANRRLFDSICNKEINLRDQKAHGACLSKVVGSAEGQKCVAPFKALDWTAKNAAANVCKVMNSVMGCSSRMIETECGFEALLHVFALHMDYAITFDNNCVLASPEPLPTTSKAPEPQPEPEPTPTPQPKPEPTQASDSHPRDVRTRSSSSMFASFALLVLLPLLRH